MALTKQELIELVEKIQRCEGTEQQQTEWILLFKASVPHPAASDLIFYSAPPLSAVSIVEKALSYRPIHL